MLNKDNIIEDKTLAKEIEDNILCFDKLQKIVKFHITKYKIKSYKEIVLWCTHYELVRELFKKNCPKIKFIDNSDYVINKINVCKNDNNIVFLQSKQDEQQKQKMLYLINKAYTNHFFLLPIISLFNRLTM